MSTIQVNAIQSSSGTQEVSQTTLYSGTAKAWCHYDMSAATIDNSFATSSLTDNGTGDFDINLSSTMSYGAHGALSACRDLSTVINTTTTTAIEHNAFNSIPSKTDSTLAVVSTYGDLA